ncbi:MAG: M48 family metallopeptidase [Anaerolineaceae bacterium]|nr:M48 family metallopeptidase [Anaerolineaceae bacterium]
MSSQIQYTIQISRRARHVRLKISRLEGLVVVIPSGFDPGRVPQIVSEKADWINRTQNNLAKQPQPANPELVHALPACIRLPLTGETWKVEYVQSKSRGLTLTYPGDLTLRLTGTVTNKPLIQAALRRWIRQRAKTILPMLLTDMARQLGFKVNAITIRNQRTRWGSCSRNKNVSLNQKLIFLPQELVRYIMLHELCHTQVMSHSQRFWSLVARHDSQYKMKIIALRTAMKYLPVWA